MHSSVDGISFLRTDIHEFHTYTLESHSKSTETKTEETLKLAERWEQYPPPIPTEQTEIARKTLDVSKVRKMDGC